MIEIKTKIFIFRKLENDKFIFLFNSFQKQPPGVLWKKMFLEILQNSQENTCARVLKCRLQAATLLKKDSGTSVFL